MRIIGGIHRNKFLSSPKVSSTRPTSGQLRECLFNICQHYVEDAKFLDLFSGSGAMGIEALSRGASHATFVEKNKEACVCIRKNLDALHLNDHAVVLGIDIVQALHYLAGHHLQFDIIYSDPPYKIAKEPSNNYNEQVLTFIDENRLLTPSGILFLENPLEAPTSTENLKSLCLKNSRRLGRSILQEFIHKQAQKL